MRTRILNKMLASEVEEYLARGGNTIFMATGVVEVHGIIPIDVEQIVPEAYSVCLAEEFDGLALINNPYFFPGGTIVSNATVQMSVRDSIDYLMKIWHSLVAQGFRNIFIVDAHGPATLYVDAAVRDFFQETKVMVCHINMRSARAEYNKRHGIPQMTMEQMMARMRNPENMKAKRVQEYGAYRIMGQEEYLPVVPGGKGIPVEMAVADPRLATLQEACRKCGCKAAYYFSKPEEHLGYDDPAQSIEERDALCAQGEAEIREIASLMPIKELQDALDEYEGYIKDMQEKYPRLKGIY